ncbi:MAG TPA: hypothetical protein VMS09_02320 [Paenibacillus sp.]|nr:hypothetical protein [Paenibacillus sp.]HUC90844.1 hypothetical protein [Paenibacillus sp.]
MVVVQGIDWLIMLVAGALLAAWLFRRFYVWLHQPPASRIYLLGKGGVLEPDDEQIRFLEDNGYDVVSGKHRVPITIGLDGQPLRSRLFIDYVAEKDGKTYLVKTARDRMPMDWTGSGVRDRLFMYALLVPSASGILFIDSREKSIRTITFIIGEPSRGDNE